MFYTLSYIFQGLLIRTIHSSIGFCHPWFKSNGSESYLRSSEKNEKKKKVIFSLKVMNALLQKVHLTAE